jgi:superfamily II DNA or RNA helicase
MSIDLLKDIINFETIGEYLENLSCLSLEDNFSFVFEVFAKNFLLLDERLSYRVKNVYLFQEIPVNILKKLKLPTKDKGIDLIIETIDETYIAVQVKYRSNINKVIPWGDLSTFEALTLRNDKFEYGILFSNTLEPCEDLKENKKMIFYMNDVITNSNLFLNKVKQELGILPLENNFESKIELRKYQKIAIKRTIDKFKNNDRLKLIMAPGTGKTITSLRIYERMLGEYCNTVDNDDEINHILLFVCPYLNLVNQTFQSYFSNLRIDKKDFQVMCIASESEKNEYIEHKISTNVDDIEEFLTSKGHLKIIFCTFSSSNRVTVAIENTNKVIDLCIVDECHKTVNNSHTYSLLNECDLISKFLFLTGTERIIDPENKRNTGSFINSMSNKKIYGDYAYQYGLRRAINEGYLCDYQVKVITSFESSINKKDVLYLREIDEKANMDILITCLMISDSFKKGDINKCLIFFNRRKEAFIASKLLEYLLAKETDIDIYNLPIHKKNRTLRDFEKSSRAIITNCFVLRTGADIPCIDSICFFSDMSSKLDVIQSISRALRVYPNKKISTIILPIILKDDNDFKDNQKFINVRNVILALSSEDREMKNFLAESIINKKMDNKKKKVIFEVCGELKKKKKENQEIIINKIQELNDKIFYNIISSCRTGEIHWNLVYNELKEYLKENNNIYPSSRSSDKNQRKLNGWLTSQKGECKFKLTPNQIFLLESLPNFEWKKDLDLIWMNNFDYLKKYINEYDKYPSSKSKNKLEKKSSHWISGQRCKYNGTSKIKLKLSDEQIELLESLPNFRWNIEEDTWNEKYLLLKKHLKENNGRVPSCKKENGEISLHSWLCLQRYKSKKNKITEEQIKLMDSLPNFTWLTEDTWMKKYLELKEYLKNNNNKYPTKKDESFVIWIWTQKRNYAKNKLSKKRIKLLEDLPNFILDSEKNKERLWEENYLKLKLYVKNNKRLPPEVKSKEDPDYNKFVNWIKYQRKIYKKPGKTCLTDSRKMKLEKIKYWRWD